MKLKDFLNICDCSDCIFGIYLFDKDEPVEEIDNVKHKSELEGFYNSTVVSVAPYNENKIAVMVYV